MHIFVWEVHKVLHSGSYHWIFYFTRFLWSIRFTSRAHVRDRYPFLLSNIMASSHQFSTQLLSGSSTVDMGNKYSTRRSKCKVLLFDNNKCDPLDANHQFELVHETTVTEGVQSTNIQCAHSTTFSSPFVVTLPTTQTWYLNRAQFRTEE